MQDTFDKKKLWILFIHPSQLMFGATEVRNSSKYISCATRRSKWIIVMLTFLDVDTHSIIIASIGFPLRYVTVIEWNLEIPSRYVMAPEMGQSVTSIHGAGNKASRSALVLAN